MPANLCTEVDGADISIYGVRNNNDNILKINQLTIASKKPVPTTSIAFCFLSKAYYLAITVFTPTPVPTAIAHIKSWIG